LKCGTVVLRQHANASPHSVQGLPSSSIESDWVSVTAYVAPQCGHA